MSRTMTISESASGCPTVPVCASPETRLTCAGAAGVALAVKTPAAGSCPTLASTVSALVPAVVPSVTWTAALPSESVVTEEAETDPPPAVTRHETATPRTGEPSDSVTRAMSGWDSGAPALPVWPLPASGATAAGTGVTGPDVSLAHVAVTTSVASRETATAARCTVKAGPMA